MQWFDKNTEPLIYNSHIKIKVQLVFLEVDIVYYIYV